MPLFQEGTAETFNFMLLGMGAILGMMAIYIVNLVVRWRNARQEMRSLEELQAEEG